MIRQHKIYFNSKDRISGTTTNLKYPLATTIPNVVSIAISNVRLPITYYNVTNKNNTLSISLTGGDYEVVVENKNYSATDLAATVKTTLGLALPGVIGAGATVAYNSNTGKFTFSLVGTNFKVMSSGLGSFMGFSKDTGFSTGSHTSDSMADFSPTPIYIATELQTDSELNQNLVNIVYTATGSVSFGSILYDNDKNLEPIELIKKKNINHLKFSLVDGDGDEINNNGIDYSMVVTLFYMK